MNKKSNTKTTCLLLITTVMVSGLFSCHSVNQNTYKDPLNLSGMDTAIRPQDDLFDYANGGWLKKTTIPASLPAWGGMLSLADKSVEDMHVVLDSVAHDKNITSGSYAQKAGDLFASGMDSSLVEKLGDKPILTDLDRISAIKNLQDFWKEIATEYSIGLSPLFNFNAGADDKNSSMNIAHFDQGGLGLPNKDYYFNKDSATRKIRDAYLQYIVKLFQLTGNDAATAQKDASSVLASETAMAKNAKSPVALRDPIANYHKVTIASLEKTIPNLDWNTLLNEMLIKEDTVLMGQPEFYQGLNHLVKSIPLNDWKNYLRFHFINHFASYLSNDFVQARFDFTKLLTGQQEIEPRWKRMCRMVDDNLGDALGQLYVQRFFPPESKKRMIQLVNNLQQTFAERIQHLDWMSDSTKAKALIKLHAILKKIGYPDKWKDYSSVNISRDSLVTDLKNCSHYAYMYDINKLGKPVDKSEWYMTPPTVDAYYDRTENNINFPAGILQPPFFYKNGDDAINYGAIGIVIGHEMTHGFDDEGRHYDANGNLKDWWTLEDAKRFTQKADLIVKQYDEYTVLDSLHINGKLTEGENIADIGGASIAYAAFQKTAEAHKDTLIDGFTPDQRFFLSLAAGIWRVKYRPAILRTMLLNNPHSPAKYRVIGPFSDNLGFYKAFDVKPGDRMYHQDSVRVSLW
ncbi:MAG TPA: M13 family metallopeptidase [Hanamia sp.]|nr:M13 family metallopeptidase [Hanamia sp.]